jgi:hypothetical protein
MLMRFTIPVTHCTIIKPDSCKKLSVVGYRNKPIFSHVTRYFYQFCCKTCKEFYLLDCNAV